MQEYDIDHPKNKPPKGPSILPGMKPKVVVDNAETPAKPKTALGKPKVAVGAAALVAVARKEVKRLEKASRGVKHKVYSNDAVIERLMDQPPIKAGSNRCRNMLTVMESKTVGEALERLRALTPPGVPFDIDLAVQKNAIKILT